MLSNTRAVTAAHCWFDGRSQARSFTLVFGSHLLFSGGVRVATTNVQMHANYNHVSLHNDIAIVIFNWVGYTSQYLVPRLANPPRRPLAVGNTKERSR